MIVKSNGCLIDTQSICFSLMYRCQQCHDVVHGTQDKAGDVTCEKCDAPLFEDDEIAYRLDGDE